MKRKPASPPGPQGTGLARVGGSPGPRGRCRTGGPCAACRTARRRPATARQREARGERIDLVLPVEAHHLLVEALSVVLVLLLQALDLRLHLREPLHAVELLEGQRQQHARTTSVMTMIERPQPNPTVSWKNLRMPSKKSTRGCRTLAKTTGGTASGVWRRGRVFPRRTAEQGLGCHGVVATVAERVAAQQAPRREQGAAQYAVGLNRLHRIGGARGVVLAPARQSGRDDALVDQDRRQATCTAMRRRRGTSRQTPRLRPSGVSISIASSVWLSPARVAEGVRADVRTCVATRTPGSSPTATAACAERAVALV